MGYVPVAIKVVLVSLLFKGVSHIDILSAYIRVSVRKPSCLPCESTLYILETKKSINGINGLLLNRR